MYRFNGDISDVWFSHGISGSTCYRLVGGCTNPFEKYEQVKLEQISREHKNNLTPIPNVNENKEKIPTNMHEQKYKLQTQSWPL